MCFFARSVLRCMHPHCGVISRKLQCSGCVWPTTLAAGLSITCRGGRVLVVNGHQIHCCIPTFDALLRKQVILVSRGLKRCKKSNNAWVQVLMQSDCLFQSPFFDHYNRIMRIDWLSTVCLHMSESVWILANSFTTSSECCIRTKAT